MKKLICMKDVELLHEQGKTIIEIAPGTIITPAAEDAAKEMGLIFQTISYHSEKSIQTDKSEVDGDLVYQVLQMLMKRGMLDGFLNTGLTPPYQEELDSSGMRIVHGESIRYEAVTPSGCNDQIFKREVFNTRSFGKSAGYWKLENINLSLESVKEEILIVLNGEAEVSINGNRYLAKEEDMLYIPKGAKITWQVKKGIKLFYMVEN